MYDPNPDDSEGVRVQRAVALYPVQAIIADQLEESEKTTEKCGSDDYSGESGRERRAFASPLSRRSSRTGSARRMSND